MFRIVARTQALFLAIEKLAEFGDQVQKLGGVFFAHNLATQRIHSLSLFRAQGELFPVHEGEEAKLLEAPRPVQAPTNAINTN